MPIFKDSSTHFLKMLLIGVASLSSISCTTLSETSIHNIVDTDAQLRVATWNVEHLAYPIDKGCKPRTETEINAMRTYVKRVDADIFALQEVASESAVRLLFPTDEWQVFFSPRQDSKPYICRGSGRESTQQKTAYAVKKSIQVNSFSAISELALNSPGLRYGLEMNVDTDLGPITLLNVHMKSGCFVDNYSRSDSTACKVLAQQAPILDIWIEQKEQDNTPYLVLGDFNHLLTAPYNHLTQKIFTHSDGSATSMLNTTRNMIGCHPYYPAPIDNIFIGEMPMNRDKVVALKSIAHDFDNMDPKQMLSDHCAVSLSINPSPLALSNAVKWQTQSKEYAFLTRASNRDGRETSFSY